MSKRPAVVDLTRDAHRRRTEPYPPPAPRKWPPAEPEKPPAERLADYLQLLKKWGEYTGDRRVQLRLDAQPRAHRALQQMLSDDDASLSRESIWGNLAFDEVTHSYGIESSERPEDVVEKVRRKLAGFKRQYGHESPSTRADRWLNHHLANSSELVDFAEQLRLARLYKNMYHPPSYSVRGDELRKSDVCKWARQPRSVEDIAFDYARAKPVKFWGTRRP